MSTSDTRLWNAVHDMAVLDGKDAEMAEREADGVITTLKLGHGVVTEEKHRERRAWAVRALKAAGGFAVVGAVAAALVAAFVAIARHNNNDFAGYGQGRAIDHARYAATAWYGRDNAPSRLEYLGRKHDFFYGQNTWKVTFRKPDRERVCVWVWLEGDPVPGSYSGPGDTDNWLVRTGAQC